jgi:hypothetical protein
MMLTKDSFLEVVLGWKPRSVAILLAMSNNRYYYAQATPDLLKGQQEISQQTNEETARQILFNYLKEG